MRLAVIAIVMHRRPMKMRIDKMTVRTVLAAILLGAAAVPVAPVTAQSVSTAVTARAKLQVDRYGPAIHKEIFGQFAEHLGTGIYGGVWVGPDSKIPNVRGIRKDVVAALRNLAVPVVRWPGGCFADEYHWRDGIGPRGNRPVKVNTNWGGVTEPNAFGTHEFMDFIEQIGAEPYIAGNVGSGSPEEMAQWVEYMTAPAGSLADERARNGHKAPWTLPYFGIGNELWGCGGNMRVEYAADVTRRYSTYIKVPYGTKMLKMASGSSDNLSADSEFVWTEGMMKNASKAFDGFGIHYYTFPDGIDNKQSASDFDEASWARTMAEAEKIDGYIKAHEAIMDRYDPNKRIGMAIDEWGNWWAPAPGSPRGFLQQQNTLRDAVTAALSINIFTHYGDRLRMANIAQMVNVLQAMILTDGPKMVLTPTYYVFEMYKPFQGAMSVPITLDTPDYANGKVQVPAVSAAAARATDGNLYITLTNVDLHHPVDLEMTLVGSTARAVSGRILTAPTIQSRNDFEHPDSVRPVPFDGARLDGQTLHVALPPHAIVMLSVR
jgi:alpha-N-arabinofuranosidase